MLQFALLDELFIVPKDSGYEARTGVNSISYFEDMMENLTIDMNCCHWELIEEYF